MTGAEITTLVDLGLKAAKYAPEIIGAIEKVVQGARSIREADREECIRRIRAAQQAVPEWE